MVPAPGAPPAPAPAARATYPLAKAGHYGRLQRPVQRFEAGAAPTPQHARLHQQTFGALVLAEKGCAYAALDEGYCAREFSGKDSLMDEADDKGVEPEVVVEADATEVESVPDWSCKKCKGAVMQKTGPGRRPKWYSNGLCSEECAEVDDDKEVVVLGVVEAEDEGAEADEEPTGLASHTRRFEIPDGFRLAPPPSAAQLEFRNGAAQQLVGKSILFNWEAAGWCLGEITRTNPDRHRIVEKDAPANFFVHYKIDDNELKHKLNAEDHGYQEVPNVWVLLEEA